MTAADRDLRDMRRLVIEGAEDDGDADLLLPRAVVDGLRSLVGFDVFSVAIIDSANEIAIPRQDLPAAPVEGEPLTPAQEQALFFRHYWQCLPCSYPDRTGDLDSVTRMSDFYSLRQLRSTGMWSDYLGPAGLKRDLMACLAGRPGRTLRLLLWRGPSRDFTERERTIVWLLRPHLYRLYRQRHVARSGAADLTPRQRQLLGLVAAGSTDRQIARQLGITESTVRKHLQHAFERLHVNSRAAAVVRAFRVTDLPPA
jgi:DNA-binding CsgD family transcriptional regulator